MRKVFFTAASLNGTFQNPWAIFVIFNISLASADVNDPNRAVPLFLPLGNGFSNFIEWKFAFRDSCDIIVKAKIP